MRSLIFAMIAIGLIACRTDSETGTAQPAIEQETAAAPSVVLRVWTTENDPETLKVLRKIGEGVSKTSNSVSEVEITSIKWSSLNVKLQQAFAAGTMPGVVHIPPFFTKYFVAQDLLLPVDEIVRELGEEDIHEAVRKVAFFNGHYYGIPQHFATSYIVYNRRLFDAKNIAPPRTWEEMLKAAAKLTEPDKKRYGVHIPGGDRFFVDSIFFEVLASLGGRIFEQNGKAVFDDPKVIRALEYMKQLVKYAPPYWQTETYMGGFDRMIREEVAINLMVGARATKTLEKKWDGAQVPAHEVFLPLMPPRADAETVSFATVDCEAYGIINQAKNRSTSSSQGAAIEAASRQYLRAMFGRSNYIDLTNSVPIGLMPIFKSLMDEHAKLEHVTRWKSWHDHAQELVEEKRLNPFLTVSFDDLKVSGVYELFGAKIVSDMVLSVLSGKSTPETAAKEAQRRADKLFAR